MTETVQAESAVDKVDFNTIQAKGRVGFDDLVKKFGIVYVTSITRDGCSGCMEQKPLYNELAHKLDAANPGKTKFSNVHISYEKDKTRESEMAKTMLRHGSYPTYLIRVKSRFGVLEHYRASYPSMAELEKQITDALELADFYEKDNDTHS